MDRFPTPDVPLDPAPAAAVVVADVPPETGKARAILEVCLCSGLPTQILVSLGLTLGGIGPRDANNHLSLPHIAILSLVDSALIVGMIVLFLRAGGERTRDVMLGAQKPLYEAVLGVALVPMLFLIMAVAAFAIVSLAPWLHQPQNPLAELLRTRTGLVVFAFIGIVAGGLREELQRAFILHRFERYLGGAVLGLIVFSLVFGLGHAVQGWSAVIITAVLGAFWGSVYLARRSIVAPCVSHALFNLLEVIGFVLL